MLAPRFFFCLLACFAAKAQTEDIHQRVLRVLGPDSGARANAFVSARQFDKAAQLVANERSAEALSLHGALEFLAGKMEAAADDFQSAGKLSDLRESDQFTLAMAWVQLGHDDQARNQLEQLQAKAPAKALYPYWLGRLDYDQRRYAEAVEKLKRAAELDGNSARTWDSLGLAYDMQGKADDALKAFEEGARVNRNQPHKSAWPPHDLGALLLRSGDAKGAAAAFREALQYDPQMEQAHYHLGRALEKDGETEEAAREYSIAMQQDPRAPDVCYSLAMLYRKMGRDKDSAALFEEWRKRRAAQP